MRKCFIDQSDLLAFGVFGVNEESACEQRGSEDGKIRGADARDFGRRSPLDIERVILDEKGRLKMVEIHRQAGAAANCGLLDSWERLDALQNFAVQRGLLFGSEIGVIFRILGHSQPDFCRDELVRFEARLHLKNALEAADQKTCADQANEREGNLRGHKNAREFELSVAGAGAAGALAKRPSMTGARRL